MANSFVRTCLLIDAFNAGRDTARRDRLARTILNQRAIARLEQAELSFLSVEQSRWSDSISEDLLRMLNVPRAVS